MGRRLPRATGAISVLLTALVEARLSALKRRLWLDYGLLYRAIVRRQAPFGVAATVPLQRPLRFDTGPMHAEGGL